MNEPRQIIQGGCTNPDPEKLGLPENPRPEPLRARPLSTRLAEWIRRILQALRLRARQSD